MGSTHFLTKTLPRVSTEMSLHVPAYNLKRMMSIFGIAGLLEAIRACPSRLSLFEVFSAFSHSLGRLLPVAH
jgi:hypothetical protein